MDAQKALIGLVIVFLGFWMFTDPSGLAEVASTGAQEAWALLETLFNAIIRFLGELA